MADLEETQERIEQVTDAVRDISSKMEQLAAHKFGDEIANTFDQSARNASDLSKHLEAIVKSGAGLPKSIKTAADLQKAMVRNAELFQNVQEQVLAIQKKKLEEYDEVALEKVIDQLEVMDDIEAAAQFQDKVWEKLAESREKATESLEQQLELMQAQEDSVKGFKKVLRGLGEVIPASLVKFFKDMPGALKNALSQKEFKGAVESISKPIDDLLDSIPYVGGVLKAGFQIIRKGFFSVWDYVESRVLPTNIRLTKQFGSLTPEVNKLGRAAVSMGDRFERMGDGMGRAAREAVVDFGAALKTTDFPGTRKGMRELADMGVRLTQVLGMSAEEAGNLHIAFDRAGLSTQDLEKSMVEASVVAESMGIPIGQVQKDMGQFPSILQRFGAANALEFSKAAAMARAYGTSIDNVNKSFGQQLDSFEGSSEAAAKLNAIFGTQINSYKLMMETDPTKRMAMLGKELVKQGKHWNNLNVFEKNVIKSTLGVDDAMGALVLSQKNVGKSSEEMSKIMENQQKKQEALERAQKRWDRSIQGLREQLLNFRESVDRIVRALANVVAKVIGLPSAASGTMKTAEKLRIIFDKVAVAIENWGDSDGPNRLMKKIEKFFDIVERASESWLVRKALGLEDVDTARASELKDLEQEQKKKHELLWRLEQEHQSNLDQLEFEHLTKRDKDAIRKDNERLEQRIAGAKEAVEAIDKEVSGFSLVPGGELISKDGVPLDPDNPPKFDDVLITSTGKSIQFNPKDNILATQAPIAEILPKLSEIVSMATNTKSSGMDSAVSTEIRELTRAVKDMKNQRDSGVKVEVVDVVMDGRKIGEAQVRLSRS